MSLLGALLALVGVLVTALVPDADAAGLTLCCCGFALTRAPTLRTRSSGHNLTAGRDDFPKAEVRP